MADVKIITDSKADATRRRKAGVRLLAQLVVAASGFACMVCPPFMGIDVLVCPLTGLFSTVLMTFIGKQRTWNAQPPSAAMLADQASRENEHPNNSNRIFLLTCLVQMVDVFDTDLFSTNRSTKRPELQRVVDYILQGRTWDSFAKGLLLGTLNTTDMRNVTLMQFMLCGDNGSDPDAFVNKFDRTYTWLSKMTEYSNAAAAVDAEDMEVLVGYLEMCSNTTMW